MANGFIGSAPRKKGSQPKWKKVEDFMPKTAAPKPAKPQNPESQAAMAKMLTGAMKKSEAKKAAEAEKKRKAQEELKARLTASRAAAPKKPSPRARRPV